MTNSTFWNGIKQIIALVFVNVIALLVDPSYLQTAISIDCLVLGISIYMMTSKKTEERLDLMMQENINLAKQSTEILKTVTNLMTQQKQQKVVV